MPRLVYAVEPAATHYFPGHPECPQRVTAIQEALKTLDVFRGAEEQVQQLEAVPDALPEGLLLAVHTAAHVESLAATSAGMSGPTAIRDPDDPDGPTYATHTTYEDALRAARVAVALVDAVAASSTGGGGGSSEAGGGRGSPAASGFGICRPPGHHATAAEQMGFCLLNNAALAARHAQRAHGLRRVLVLDWDVHHGNGTQDLFYSDPSVLFIDIHQAGVWPGSGALDETGVGEGKGYTLNVPLPVHSGHVAAQRAFDQVVAPAARRFRPDLIIVSTGYDAHWQDPLEELQLQLATYHWLTAAVRGLADELCCGRLVMLLEGGYNQEALGQSVADTVLALLGRPAAIALLAPEQLPQPEPLEAADAVLQEVRSVHGLQ